MEWSSSKGQGHLNPDLSVLCKSSVQQFPPATGEGHQGTDWKFPLERITRKMWMKKGLHDIRLLMVFWHNSSKAVKCCITLVGNDGDISGTCLPNTPHSHNLEDIWNVANTMTGFMAGSCVGWRVTARLPSHIHDFCGHYSDGSNGRFWGKNELYM